MWLRKRNSWCLALVLILIIIPNVLAIRINEVELNPLGGDAGNEWVELYSESEVNLNDYKFINNDGDEVFLNESFSGYYVYTFNKQWLDNSDEKVFLYKNETLVDETDLLEDSGNNGSSWSYCGEWVFIEGTKEQENNCVEEQEEIIEVNETIEVKEKVEEEQETIKEDIEKPILEIEEINNEITENKEEDVIYLEPQSIKNTENEKYSEILFKSKNENIKSYAIYGFAIFCVLIIVLLVMERRYNK